MIRPAAAKRKRSRRAPSAAPEEADTSGSRPGYGRLFWLAYLSNLLVAVSYSLLYRYADFVTLLGGSELHLGWIVGVGMVGSLAARLVLGSSIDTYGTRIVWLGSTLLLSATCFAHLLIDSYAGPGIYLLRISYCVAVAGINGAAITFVAGRLSTVRAAELIGVLGTGGFIAIVFGSHLSDFMLARVDHWHVAAMFVVAGTLALLSFPVVWIATRSETRPVAAPRPSLLELVRQHNPGAVLAVGVAMGFGLGLPQTFLRTYAAELHISRIAVFFTVYSITAVAARIATRRWPERFGVRRLMLLGLGGEAAALALFPAVSREWQLIVPALACGCSHAILFPSVVAAGSATFPPRHRGLAMLLVLASWDIGVLVGAPVAGAIVQYSQPLGLPPYPTMFLSVAAGIAAVMVWYASVSRGEPAADETVAVAAAEAE